MIKKIIISLFLLVIGFIFYLMVTETIASNKYFLEVLKEYDNNPFLNSSLGNLTPEEIKTLTIEYKIELTQLEHLKSIAVALISLCGILLITILLLNEIFQLKISMVSH